MGRARPRTTSTSPTRARSSTPTTTTSRRSRTESSSTSRCGSSSPDVPRARSSASSGPRASARPASAVDRAGARPRVRADLGRRRPRRGRDPRPPPDLHRRDAGDDRPRAARRRHPQPGVHDRRDRQDGRRLPRRPVERDARGPRPGPERHASATTTSTSPFDLSEVLFITTANTLDTIPPAAPGPDGGDPARRLHRSTRSSTSPSATWCRARSSRTGCARSQISFTDAGAAGRSSTSTPARPGCANLEREIGSVCRKVAREVAEGEVEAQGRRSRRSARGSCWAAPVLRRAAAPHQGPRRGDRARLDAGRRRGPVRRGDGDAGRRQADDHRPARRRDARVGAGGALLGARPLGRLAPELPEDWFADHDIHIHVPAGAVPKDGPSAGVAMATALVSLVTPSPVARTSR